MGTQDNNQQGNTSLMQSSYCYQPEVYYFPITANPEFKKKKKNFKFYMVTFNAVKCLCQFSS